MIFEMLEDLRYCETVFRMALSLINSLTHSLLYHFSLSNSHLCLLFFQAKFLQNIVQKECEERFELTEALSEARRQLLEFKRPPGVNCLAHIVTIIDSESPSKCSFLPLVLMDSSLPGLLLFILLMEAPCPDWFLVTTPTCADNIASELLYSTSSLTKISVHNMKKNCRGSSLTTQNL